MNERDTLRALRGHGVTDYRGQGERDAVFYWTAHDAAHALDLRTDDFNGDTIDAALRAMPPDDRLAAEVRAHAASILVCEAHGWGPSLLRVPVMAEQVVTATTEGGESTTWDRASLSAAIEAHRASPEGRALAEQVLALARVPEIDRGG